MNKKKRWLIAVVLFIASMTMIYLAMKRADSLPWRGLGRGW